MIRHDDLWRALDTLAAERGLTPSGLARAAGLDPTSFNPSKRTSGTGRPRWPGTESLARVLDITGLSLEAFGRLAGGQNPLAPTTDAGRSRLRLSTFSHLDQPGMFDGAGRPTGRHWDQWEIPGTPEADFYAVTLDTDLFEPVFRAGTILTVSPGTPVRRHDRVLVLRPEGALCAVVAAPWTGFAGTGPLLSLIGASAGGGAFEADPTDHLHRIMMAVL